MQVGPEQLQWIVPAIVVPLVLWLRFRAMKRARRLRLETMWVVPALLAAAFGIATWEVPPPTAAGWLWLALALVIGLGAGWYRGTLTRIGIDPATHRLNQQSSPAALLFVVAIIVARQGLRYEAVSIGMDVMKATGLLLAVALGAVAGSRAEMYRRARRLLAEARAQGGAVAPPSRSPLG